MRPLAEKFDAGSADAMDESKTTSLGPDLPTSLPDPLAAPKTPATARAQRLSTALRDNLRRRKAAHRSARPIVSRN